MKNKNMTKIKTKNGKINKADIVIGIPSYNEADNIAYVAENVAGGLKKYFPDKKGVIINIDSHSNDGTREAFLKAKTNSVPKIYISTPKGVIGKGNNFLNLFREAVKLKAKAVAVVDADIKSVTPKWIKNLITPVFKSFDYLTPLYTRNEYDGSLTNHICYPLIYGLFGFNIRQPIGGDFCFSDKFVKSCLKQRWTNSTKQYGIDIFLTMHAILNNFKIGQVSLGTKIHKPSAPKLGPMFHQVLTSFMNIIIKNKDKWLGAKKLLKIPLFNEYYFSEPQHLAIDYKEMRSIAIYEYKINKSTIKRVLTQNIYEKISSIFETKDIYFGKDTWTKIVYDFIYAFDKFRLDANLIDALKPLYFARCVSFYRISMNKDHKWSDQVIIDQAKNFYRRRSYLLCKYRKK